MRERITSPVSKFFNEEVIMPETIKDFEANIKEALSTQRAYAIMLTATGNTTSNAMMDNGETLTLKANRQEYTQDTNTFNASGNVKVWYQDYFAQGPKISVYPDKVTKKPNEVYFVGRSSISQGPRTIYADKIRMIINPKDFHAEGNTRTVIKNIGSGGDNDEDMTLGL